MKETLEKYLKLHDIDIAKSKDILAKLFKNFKIIPRRTTNIDAKIFMGLEYGLFSQALS